MSDTLKGAIVTGVLGIVGAIVAAFVAARAGESNGEQNVINQLNSQMAAVVGDNNEVTINSVDDLVGEYNELIDEKESLIAQNAEYFSELEEIKGRLEEFESQSDSRVSELEQQLNDKPDIQYKNAGLTIDGISMSINSNQSMVTVDGRDYVSKEMLEKVIPDDKSLTIKDDMLYIGKVIADQANLFDQKVFDGTRLETKTYKDSFGNEYPNSMQFFDESFMTYNLNRKYSLLDITMVSEENSDRNREGCVIVEADGKVVYTSPYIKKTTEPFRVQIPIENCMLLTIRFEQNISNNRSLCIISDAIVYN